MGSKNYGLGQQDEIGSHGLMAKKEGNLITIAGPCGGAHRMNLEASRELADWLQKALEPPLSPT